MRRPRKHVFVCVNVRPEGGKPACGNRGGVAIAEALSAATSSRPGLAVTPVHCLGPCFDGPNVLVYPDATWYAGVTAADVPELVTQHIDAGRPVPRLELRWPDDD